MTKHWDWLDPSRPVGAAYLAWALALVIASQPLFADHADTIRQHPFAPATNGLMQPGRFVSMEGGGFIGKIVIRM